MKVVLSRKGFDGKNGGFASPLLDGLMISLPVPVTYRQEDHRIHYADLRYGNNAKVIDLLRKMLKTKIKVAKGKKSKWRNAKELSAHLDPDLCRESYPRERGWRGLFGINGDCQKEIEENGGLRKDDLFLFFGWFKKFERDKTNQLVNAEDENYYPSGRHVIFGYLQIDKILPLSYMEPTNARIKKWMNYHPHIGKEGKIVGNDDFFENNTLYVARRKLTFAKKPGFGVFHHDPGSEVVLTLTKKGCTRSKWHLPRAFTTPKQVEITRNPHGWDTWDGGKGYFQSADIGQEFMIEECTEINKWARSLIRDFG